MRQKTLKPLNGAAGGLINDQVKNDEPAHSQESNRGDVYGPVARSLIVSATADFVRHGYEGASVSRIVKAAGCNVRMLYHYFGNKHGLYRVCLEQAYEDLRKAETEATFWQMPPAEAVDGLVRFTFDYMCRNRQFQALMRIENMTNAQEVRDLTSVNSRAKTLIEAIGAVLDRGMEEGCFASRPDPGLLYLSILGLSTIHIANRHTMSVVLGRDLGDPAFLDLRREEVVGIIRASLASTAQ
ncbi:TetR/AcrR family transcriptional regulator [Marinovum sp.]|uniref:TetR/AcrR family transcriptional regulator n=1 Tax=Marinovum sp. TaxID=2024839 RepID=UPI002B272946|nr:TetR/AcrR family transcriptional regulator [Marinovum sp.]